MKKVLIIRYSALGDVILSSSLLKYLSDKGFIVDFLTKKQYYKIFEIQDFINQVFYFKDTKDFFKIFFKIIHTQQYDYIIDLQKKLKTYLFRLKYPLKYYTYNSNRLYRHIFKKNPDNKHLIEKYFESLRFILFDYNDIEKYKRPYLQLKDNNILKTIDVLIHPFASKRQKTYPFFYWERIIKELKNREIKNILISGIETEIKIVEDCYFKNEKKYIIKDILDFSQVISSAKIVITSDSGVKHLSEALGIYTITLWGPTHPDLGFKVLNGYNFYSNLKCSPCSLHGEKSCKYGDYRCFDSYSISQIVEKIFEIIGY